MEHFKNLVNNFNFPNEFLNSLPDGWTIYLWLFYGALIIIASLVWMRWGANNEQFDEDIKYVVFSESDKDKMDPVEFSKSQSVMQAQMESRQRSLTNAAEGNAHKA